MTDLARADDAGLIEAYLAHVRVGKRLAERTVALYTEDLVKLAHFAREAAVPLRQVQPAGKRVMDAASWLNGAPDALGTILG